MSESINKYNEYGKEIVTIHDRLRPYEKLDLILKNEILYQLTEIKAILDAERKNV